jgi:amino-acid N-acetyltransferase
MSLNIAAGNGEDLPSVLALLQSAGLLFEDLTVDHMQHFMLHRQSGALLACIGQEPYGQVALLRSLAVTPAARGMGMGKRLIDALEQKAQQQGITDFYLLTTTAAPFFERLGYRQIDRLTAPAVIQATAQFSQLCPASSICLSKSI